MVATVGAGLAGAIAWYYHGQPVFATWARLMARYAVHGLLFAALCWAAYYVGRVIARGAFRFRENLWEVEWALGWVTFGFAATLLAAGGAFHAWLIRGCVVVILIVSAPTLYRIVRGVPGAISEKSRSVPAGVWWLIIPIVPFAAAQLLRAGAPPADWDSVVYHVYLPKLFSELGSFVYIPRLAYASMPLGAEMVYAWAYQWGGLGAATGAAAGMNLLLIAACWRLARLWLDPFWSTAAAVLLWITPSYAAMCTVAYVDPVQGALILMVLRSYLRGWGRWQDAALAGLLLGGALAMKYTGVYALAAFAVLLIPDLIRRRLRWRYAALFAATALVLFAPWPVKAWIERGNPFFPALYDLWGGRDLPAAVAAAFERWQSGMGMGKGFTDFVLLPYRLAFMATAGYGNFDGHILPFSLPALLLAPALFRRWRLLLFTVVYVAAWATLGSQQLRFLAGAFGPLAIVTAAALAGALSPFKGAARRWAGAVAAVAIGSWALITNYAFAYRALLPLGYVMTGDADNYLTTSLPTYDQDLYANATLPRDAKPLYLFDNTLLYKERPAVVDSFFEASETLLAVQAMNAPEEVAAYVDNLGATHVITFGLSREGYWGYYEPYTRVLWESYLRDYTRVVTVHGCSEIREVRRVP